MTAGQDRRLLLSKGYQIMMFSRGAMDMTSMTKKAESVSNKGIYVILILA